jgi:photosystem II stability/assembly factor-like uncharacterized protein
LCSKRETDNVRDQGRDLIDLMFVAAGSKLVQEAEQEGAMSRFYRVCGIFPCALLVAALFEIGAINPITAAALPSGGLISEVTALKFFDSGTGFMWGTSGSSFVIARTQNGGQTWSALNLAAMSIDLSALTPSANGGTASVYAHFADPDHGWVVWSTHESVLHIASTADSGASWRSALSLATDAVVDNEIFPGPGRACLLAEMPKGMMHTTMITVATDDDGATWTPSSIDRGDGVNGWTFRNAADGFLSVNYPSGVSILFYRTTDGGKSWQYVDLPPPPNVSPEEVGGTSPGTPVFSGPQRLTGQLTVGLYIPRGTVNVTYRSTDGGKTWTYSK